MSMQRLYEAADKLRGIKSPSDVARLLNTSPQTLNNWEARGISKSGLMTAQTVLGCSMTWLATGEGPMMLSAQVPGAMSVRVAEDDDPDFVQIPMVKLKLQAGVTGFQTEPDRRDGGQIGMRRSWINRAGLHPEALIAIHVKGDSMEPSLYDGDIVVINTAEKKPVDGVVYAFNYEGESVVKRLERDMGRWWLASDNPDKTKYGRKSCSGEECIIIGRVVLKESTRI